MVGWAHMPRSPASHVFYDRLQSTGTDRPAPFRRLCRGGLSVLLRGQAGGALEPPLGAISACTCAKPLRGHPTLSAGWNGAARIPCRYGSFYGLKAGIRVPDTIPGGIVTDPRAPPMRSARRSSTGFWLSGSPRRVWSRGERHRGRCLDHGGQRGADRNIVRRDHGRRLPAGCLATLGPMAASSCILHGRGPGAPGPQAQGQEALEPGLGLEDRPRGQDRQDEGRHDPSGLLWPEHAVDLDTVAGWPPSYLHPAA